jgi:hypothetical protein
MLGQLSKKQIVLAEKLSQKVLDSCSSSYSSETGTGSGSSDSEEERKTTTVMDMIKHLSKTNNNQKDQRKIV